jgi:hypothetical protein
MKIFTLSLLAFLTIAACGIGLTAAPTSTPPPQVAAPTFVSGTAAPKPTINPQMTEVTIQETLLNAQIGAGVPEGGQISNPRVDLHPDNLADLTANVNTGLIVLQPQVTIKLSAQDGRIVIDVLNIDVGGLGVPTALIEPQIVEIKRNAEDQLNRQFAELERTTGNKLQSITSTENELILRFAP